MTERWHRTSGWLRSEGGHFREAWLEERQIPDEPTSHILQRGRHRVRMFFPKHHVLADFPTFADANGAKAERHLAGHVEDDVIAATGEEAVQFAEEHLDKVGLWGLLMTELSRTIGTEAAYADNDLAAAKRGEAFVAVRCPSEKVKAEAWRVLESRRPLVARYYSSGGIEHMVGKI